AGGGDQAILGLLPCLGEAPDEVVVVVLADHVDQLVGVVRWGGEPVALPVAGRGAGSDAEGDGQSPAGALLGVGGQAGEVGGDVGGGEGQLEHRVSSWSVARRRGLRRG